MGVKGAKAKRAASAHVWDMLENETSAAYHAFVCYRDLGVERSLSHAVKALGKSKGYVGQLERWSSEYQWVERTRAWDAAEQKRKDEDRMVDERRVWKDAQIKERNRRKTLLNGMAAILSKSVGKYVRDGEVVEAPDPESLRSIAGAFKTYMEQSRQEFNDLPTQKVAPVDARDPEGETPYQPRLDDFAGVIEAVKQMIEADRDAD